MKNMNKSQTIASIRKNSKIIYGVLTGLFALAVLSVIALMVAAVAIPYGKEMTDVYTADFSITFNSNSPHLIGNAVAFCIGGFVATLINAAIVYNIALLFNAISKNGIPFTENTCYRIRIISILCLVNVFLPGLAVAIADIVFGTSEHFSFRFDFGAVAVFFILTVVGRIVSYGTMLQQESDETL